MLERAGTQATRASNAEPTNRIAILEAVGVQGRLHASHEIVDTDGRLEVPGDLARALGQVPGLGILPGCTGLGLTAVLTGPGPGQGTGLPATGHAGHAPRNQRQRRAQGRGPWREQLGPAELRPGYTAGAGHFQRDWGPAAGLRLRSMPRFRPNVGCSEFQLEVQRTADVGPDFTD